ncbi:MULTISPECIES: DUF4124 domain-containing protein [unclassified Pseudomonas]|uniref:DUF4124 domain-containing protein n=1 Tax=unclassified Pseudomonas TaxID=196821 RepID=UPI0015B3941D|nr:MULTISPECIES: DUF4124 domain-containing protein [unclassified Pseudomonas]
MRVTVFCLLWITALPAIAEIYQYTDAAGHRAYSDQPPKTAYQSIETPAPNRIQSPVPLPRETPRAAPPTSEQPYARLELSGVPEHGALRANNGSFSVQVELQPGLQAPHRLRLLLDDKPYGRASPGPGLQLVNLNRGQHRLAVQVLDGERVLQQSPDVTFTLLRTRRP